MRKSAHGVAYFRCPSTVNRKLIKELFSNGNIVRWDMTDKGNVRVPIGAYVWKIELERRNEEVGRTGILEVER
jgi:hypothetical protein